MIYGKLDGPGAGVEHQVQVGDAGEEIRGRQVSQQVVYGVMKPAVHEDGHHDQDVGENHKKTNEKSQGNHYNVFRLPHFADVLLALIVEELYRHVVEANHRGGQRLGRERQRRT